MKKVLSALSIVTVLLLFSPDAFAGGGSVGITPGTGFRIYFDGGGNWVHVPFRFEGEAYLGDENQHSIGGEFGFDFGTGFAPNYIAIRPKYKYYFHPDDSSPYAGASVDFRFRSGSNMIGVNVIGGYQYMFNDNIGIYAEGSLGFSSLGFNGGGRGNGGEFGLQAGFKYHF